MHSTRFLSNLNSLFCYLSKWHMMQNFYGSQRWNGLEFFLRILRSTVYQTSVSFLWRQKVRNVLLSQKWLPFGCELNHLFTCVILRQEKSWSHFTQMLPTKRGSSMEVKLLALFTVILFWLAYIVVMWYFILLPLKIGARVDAAKRSEIWDRSIVCACIILFISRVFTI